MLNALWFTDIFGLKVYNRMQKLSSCASVNKVLLWLWTPGQFVVPNNHVI